MDTPTSSDLKLVFPLETSTVVRRFPSELLLKYPNCSFAIGLRDMVCETITINYMTVEEYDCMLLVLEGQVSLLACSELVSDLLDKHGFISRLDRMLEGPLKNYQQDLIKRLTPFHHKQVSVFICTTGQEYQYCKLALDNFNVIPIQVLTMGNRVIFCSYGQGVPLMSVPMHLYDTEGQTVGELRAKAVPLMQYLTIPQTVKMSIALRNDVSNNICRNDVFSIHKVIVKPSDAELRLAFKDEQCTDAPLGTLHKLHRSKAELSHCGYCGQKIDCDCAEEICTTKLGNLNALDELDYIQAVFQTFANHMTGSLDLGLNQGIDRLMLASITRLDVNQECQIRKLVYTINWQLEQDIYSLAARATTKSAAVKRVAKLSMYVGFVRI